MATSAPIRFGIGLRISSFICVNFSGLIVIMIVVLQLRSLSLSSYEVTVGVSSAKVARSALLAE
ncbi:hypothetical protein D3C71_1836250 [compost metagenome]